LRGRGPGFATVLFTARGSNSAYIQDTRRLSTIMAFQEITVPDGVRVAAVDDRRDRAVGDEALFGFLTAREDVLVGTRAELRLPLINHLPALVAYPFIRHQVAKFVGEPNVTAEAGAIVASILNGSRALDPGVNVQRLPAADAVPVVELLAPVFRLSPGPKFKLDFTEEPEELASALSEVSQSRRLRGRASHSLAVFSLFRPTPTRFGAGPGAYAAIDTEAAIVLTAHHLQRFAWAAATEMGLRQRYELIRWDVEGRFHDLSNEVEPFEEDDQEEQSTLWQALAGEFRARGSSGIIYRSSIRPSSKLVFLFSPSPIVDTDVFGSVEISIHNKRVSWEIS
jgi:RES domain